MHYVTQEDLNRTPLAYVDIEKQLRTATTYAALMGAFAKTAECFADLAEDYTLPRITDARRHLIASLASLDLLEQLVETGNVVTKKNAIEEAVRALSPREKPVLKVIGGKNELIGEIP